MVEQIALTTANGSLWVQKDGPNTKPEYIGCATLEDITEPQGDSELIQCMKDDQLGKWDVKGETVSPPGAVTTKVSSLSFATRSILEELADCPFVLYAIQKQGGRPDNMVDWSRATILYHTKVKTRTDSNIVHRDTDSATEFSLDLSAWHPVIRPFPVVARRQTTALTKALNDIWFYSKLDCNLGIKAGDQGLVGSEGDVAAKPKVGLTDDAGATWAATATDPFVNNDDIMSVTAFEISDGVTRLLVALLAPAAGQGKVAYSDDGGTTWTTVNIGGAADGHGANDSGALFALNMHHIWLASAEGYIYFSEDGGETWTAQSDGDIVTSDFNAIAFKDEKNGMCIGASDVVLITSNGGATWEQVTGTSGAGSLACVAGSGNFWWIGDNGGKLWYSRNDGSSWTQRTGWTGSATGTIADISFVNDLVGFMIHNTSGPVGTVLRTIDGGFTWSAIATPTNTGLNALFAIDENAVYACGAPQGGTDVIVKVSI